ncbi:hypothetical protein, partial [Ralstonia chuxiongensis]
MQSFFVAVNNSSKNFYHQLAANYHSVHRQSPTTQSTANPLQPCFSTTKLHRLNLRFGAVFCSEGR